METGGGYAVKRQSLPRHETTEGMDGPGSRCSWLKREGREGKVWSGGCLRQGVLF